MALVKTALSTNNSTLLDTGVEFPKGPEDTVSALRWSPAFNHVAAACWDGHVYIYDVTHSTTIGGIKGIRSITANAAFLDCDFSKDGTLAAAGATDNKIHVIDLASGNTMALAGHGAPVRAVRFVDIPRAGTHAPLLVSGSWDRTLCYWDLRQPQPIGRISLSERVYAMDASGPLLAAATPDRQIHLVHLDGGNPLAVSKKLQSQLVHQPSCIAVSADGSHWAAGSIEGRVDTRAVDEKEGQKFNFTFRCHRRPSSTSPKSVTEIYAVNALCFSPRRRDVLASAGSDGTLFIWDLGRHQRLKSLPALDGAITAMAFSSSTSNTSNTNNNRDKLVYAVGYDWAKGYRGNTATYPRRIVLCDVGDLGSGKK